MFGTYTYNQVIRKCVVAFGTLFNSLEVRKLNKDGTVYQRMKVPLAYGPRQKFLARILEQPELNKTVAITLPRLSFEMTGISYDPSRKLSPLTLTRKVDDANSVKKQYTPVPYNIDFELNIISKTNDEALELVEQILPNFQPGYSVSIRMVDEMEEYRDTPIVLNNISFTDDYEGSFDDRKIVLFTLNFTAKTYVYGPVGASGVIKKASVDYYTKVDLTATRQVSYQVTPQAKLDYDKDATLTLTQDITAKTLTFSVSDYALVDIGNMIEVGNEVMKVTSKPEANKITVTRAQNGTTANAVANGTPIDIITIADDALVSFGDDFGFNEMRAFYG